MYPVDVVRDVYQSVEISVKSVWAPPIITGKQMQLRQPFPDTSINERDATTKTFEKNSERAGSCSNEWNSKSVSSVYFYQFQAENFEKTINPVLANQLIGFWPIQVTLKTKPHDSEGIFLSQHLLKNGATGILQIASKDLPRSSAKRF